MYIVGCRLVLACTLLVCLYLFMLAADKPREINRIRFVLWKRYHRCRGWDFVERAASPPLRDSAFSVFDGDTPIVAPYIYAPGVPYVRASYSQF